MIWYFYLRNRETRSVAENAFVASLLRFLFSGPAGAAHIGEPPSQQIWFDLFLICFWHKACGGTKDWQKKKGFHFA